MNDSPQDRRVATRHIAHLAAEIEIDGKVVGCGVSVDASAQGILVLTRRKLDVGQNLVVRLRVPHEPDSRRLEGVVVRITQLPIERRRIWRYDAAIAFHSPPPDFERIVRSVSRGFASSWPPPTSAQ